MLATDKNTIKQKLEQEYSNLLAIVGKKQTSIQATDLTNPDNSDRAMASQNKDRDLLLLDHVKEQLDDIEQALSRLERGTYGICTNCHKNIQPERLEIMPTAALCVQCQREQDNK